MMKIDYLKYQVDCTKYYEGKIRKFWKTKNHQVKRKTVRRQWRYMWRPSGCKAGFIQPLFAMGLVSRINEGFLHRLDFWFFSSRKRTIE